MTTGKAAGRRAARAMVLPAIVWSGLAIAGGGKAEPVAGEIDRGQELAARLCAVCHLNPGQGEKVGSAAVPGFRAVARRPGQTREGIVAWLRGVPPMMPDHKLNQDEMQALAAYILSLAEGSGG